MYKAIVTFKNKKQCMYTKNYENNLVLNNYKLAQNKFLTCNLLKNVAKVHSSYEFYCNSYFNNTHSSKNTVAKNEQAHLLVQQVLAQHNAKIEKLATQ